jgi:hypothetical protein
MSPIIATMLLIALAVSIGATVMSVGGLYYEKIRLEGGVCSEVLISAFGLGRERECLAYEHKSILNFYRSNDTVITPECYTGILTGKGDICTTSNALLDSSWAPIKESIR